MLGVAVAVFQGIAVVVEHIAALLDDIHPAGCSVRSENCAYGCQFFLTGKPLHFDLQLLDDVRHLFHGRRIFVNVNPQPLHLGLGFHCHRRGIRYADAQSLHFLGCFLRRPRQAQKPHPQGCTCHRAFDARIAHHHGHCCRVFQRCPESRRHRCSILHGLSQGFKADIGIGQRIGINVHEMPCLFDRNTHGGHVIRYDVGGSSQIYTGPGGKVEHSRHGGINLLGFPARHAKIAHGISGLRHGELRCRAKLPCLCFQLLHIGVDGIEIALPDQPRLREGFDPAHGVFKIHGVFYRPDKRLGDGLRRAYCSLKIPVGIESVGLCLVILRLCRPPRIGLLLRPVGLFQGSRGLLNLLPEPYLVLREILRGVSSRCHVRPDLLKLRSLFGKFAFKGCGLFFRLFKSSPGRPRVCLALLQCGFQIFCLGIHLPPFGVRDFPFQVFERCGKSLMPLPELLRCRL